MKGMYFIARDRDEKLYKFPYWDGMTATDKPHRHVRGYPFNGNFYMTGNNYQPEKGEEIDGDLFPEITYENSPVLVLEK